MTLLFPSVAQQIDPFHFPLRVLIAKVPVVLNDLRNCMTKPVADFAFRGAAQETLAALMAESAGEKVRLRTAMEFRTLG